MEPKFAPWNNGRKYEWNGLGALASFRQGDGVFETLRTYGGTPFLLDRHVDRLRSGATSIGITGLPEPCDIVDTVNRELSALKTVNSQDEHIIRMALFPDASDWGFALSIEALEPGFPFPYETGLTVGFSSYPHPGRYFIPPGHSVQIKWLSRGPLSHALRDARKRGWEEGLLLNQINEIVEGTRSNVFAIFGDVMFAPGPSSYALPGITREIAVNCAMDRGLEIVDKPIPQYKLKFADEIFLTSSLLAIAPVLKIDSGFYSKEGPGEITNSLINLFKEKISEDSNIQL